SFYISLPYSLMVILFTHFTLKVDFDQSDNSQMYYRQKGDMWNNVSFCQGLRLTCQQAVLPIDTGTNVLPDRDNITHHIQRQG
ncbi:MAG: hypothetical protein KDD06_20755, partial [Phaeodactylibacter sp.]|nr:hypothetical protein [Phaeodactylibacter sp.]